MTSIRTLPQSLVVLGFFLSFLVYVRYWRTQTTDRLVGALVFMVASLAVIFPESMGIIAKAIGIERGADLVVYGTGTASIFAFVVLYAKAARVDQQVTRLVRAVAISEAKEPQRPAATPSNTTTG